MTWLKHFQRNKRRYEIAFITLLLFSDALLLASSHIMESQRSEMEPSFELWEPFVWQFSSAILVAILLPLLVYLIDSPLSSWSKIKRTFLIYLAASLLFSVLHVIGMVAIRKLIYATQGLSYDFGSPMFEFIYEYRKDVFTFISIIVMVHSYRFISSRILGEAEMINEGEEPQARTPDRLLVKKLGKEFIVKLSDVDWLEASGNYVNLYVNQRIYPTRQTMSTLIKIISQHGFCRTHRSYAVNLDAVESIAPLHSGSSDITLKNGKVVQLSRRYHEELRQRLR